MALSWRARLCGLGVFVFLFGAGVVFAGGTRFWRQTTPKDFDEGEATASVVLPTGEVAPGLKGTRLPLEAAFVYAGTMSQDGRTAFFGTGDQGRVYAVALDGAAKVKKIADLDTPWVTVLAVRKDGSLLAGSTPGGRVFILDPVKGEPKVLAKLGAEHVWALAHDPASGTTYVATGAPGKVFALDRDGKGGGKPLWDANDKQVGALLLEPGGTLLAGTSSEAIVYRIKKNGQAEALHDFDADEVRALVRVGDATYIAVNDFPSDGGGDLSSVVSAGASSTPAAKGTKVSTQVGAPAAIGSAGRAASSSVKAKAAVYRLSAEGTVEQVFTLADGYLTALAADGKGGVLAASGSQGKVYRLLPDRTYALAADLSERQALVLLPTGDGFLLGTGDVGGVYEMKPAAPGQASYLSKIFDGEAFSQWGRLRWTGGPGLQIDTRSGNTAKPDKSWNDWKRIDGAAFDGWDGEGRIASPPARYLQYRVTFAAAASARGATLKEITLAYLPQNQRARVTEVTLADAPSMGATPGSWRAHSPVLKLRWKVENPDNDPLLYRVSYRQEKETVWRPLGGPEPLSKTEYDWNTDAVPDGRYLVRVWATDEKANAGDRALDATFVSPPFLVDNTKPEVLDLAAKGTAISGRVRDAASVITAVEYSVDGEDWRPVTPADGLWDQRTEAFALRLPATVSKGPHVINVRALDAADNGGTARLEVTVP